MSAPFEISPEAERHLNSYLSRRPPSEMEPTLSRALRSHVRDKQGRLLERCDRDHYFLGYNRPEKHAGYFRLPIAGTELAIAPSTLETLRGKRLSVDRLARVDRPAQTREILVAVALDESTNKA